MKEKRNYSYVCSGQSSLIVITEQILAAAYILLMAILISGCTKNASYDPLIGDPLKAGISTVVPSNLEGSVFVDPVVTVIFKEGTNPDLISTASITLKKGDNTVPGTVTFSGTVASFSAATDLESESDYVATVTTRPQKSTDFGTMNEYSWRFRTGKNHRIDSLKVISVTPPDKAAAVTVNTPVTVTFNQELSTFMKSSLLFLLKKGATSVSGAVTITGKIMTFQPAANLVTGTVYTGSVIIGTSQVNDDKSGRTFIWSFTTAGNVADVTPPTIVSVIPAMNAATVAINAKLTATFSEGMDATTISASTFTLKQGSVAVAGNVTYSGTTATFTPSGSLSGGTMYTATITTGAKDVSGNLLASNYIWSFTTATMATGKSFTTDVMPVLNICNTCHTHGWTPSTTASTFYTNLMNSGYVNPTTPTTGKIYMKLNGGHPPGSTVSAAQKAVVLTWITEGSKNN